LKPGAFNHLAPRMYLPRCYHSRLPQATSSRILEGERVTPARFRVVVLICPSNPARRCDAKRLCTTCITAKGVSECIYDSEKFPRSTGTYPVHRADGQSPGQDLGDARPADAPSLTSTHPPAEQNPTPSTSGATGGTICESSAPRVLEADQGRRSLELVRVRRNPSGQQVSQDSNPPISVICSFPLSGIPPEPYIPLSFLGGERLQVQTSEIAATDHGFFSGWSSWDSSSPTKD